MLARFLPAAALGLVLACPAAAALRVGVVAPSGNASFARLGDQLRQGVEAYSASNGSPSIVAVDAPETCDEASGAAAAKTLVAAKVDAVIGFFCPESMTAALPVLSAAGIVTLPVSVRADIVMEDAVKHDWPVYRLAPHTGAEIATIVAAIARRWSGRPFAIVEDGTIYGRETAEKVRVGLEAMGITPAFIDTYRPAQDKQFGLAHRLERAGVTAAFVGGDRSDAAIIARDSAAIGLDLEIMGGDAMKAADGDTPLPDGALAVVEPEPETLPHAGPAIAALAAAGHDPYGYAIPGYAAAQLLNQAARKATAGSLARAVATGSFDTALGTIRFGNDHERADDPFLLMVWRNGAFVPAGSSSPPAGR